MGCFRTDGTTPTGYKRKLDRANTIALVDRAADVRFKQVAVADANKYPQGHQATYRTGR